jgi:hypothetical protein
MARPEVDDEEIWLLTLPLDAHLSVHSPNPSAVTRIHLIQRERFKFGANRLKFETSKWLTKLPLSPYWHNSAS